MSDMAERLALHEFTENAYLNYSMYVIMDRALPFIGDGLLTDSLGLSSGSSASRIFMKSGMLRALGVVTLGVPTR